MKKRILLITILVCISIIVLYLLATKTPLREPLQNVAQNTKQGIGRVLRSADSSRNTNQPNPWETWINKQVDIELEEMMRMYKAEAPWELNEFEENIAIYEDGVRRALQEMMEELKKDSDTPPPLRVIPLEELFNKPDEEPESEPKRHDGPQTAEAIYKTFEGMLYTNPELEAAYPEKEFLQMLLNRGVVINDYLDYSGYVGVRESLYFLDQNPEDRRWYAFASSVKYTKNLEKLKERFIDDQISDYEAFRAAVDADDTITGGFHKGGKFLPTGGGRVYIQLERREGGGHTQGVMGEELTEEQKFNIFYRGIEPFGYKVIYLDENYDPLTEPFKPLTPKEVLSTEKYEEYLKRKNKTEEKLLTFEEEDWEFLKKDLKWSNDFDDIAEDQVEEQMPDDAKREFRKAQFEEAQRQFEETQREEQAQFTKTMEKLIEWSSMSDEEIAADLEKLFTLEGIEQQLQEKLVPKPITPGRIEKALETLHLHGPEAGLKRLREVDPEMAKQMEQYLNLKAPSRDGNNRRIPLTQEDPR